VYNWRDRACSVHGRHVKYTQNVNMETRRLIHRGITKRLWDDKINWILAKLLNSITKNSTALQWSNLICNTSHMVLGEYTFISGTVKITVWIPNKHQISVPHNCLVFKQLRNIVPTLLFQCRFKIMLFCIDRMNYVFCFHCAEPNMF
jgi:hypothetical protein